MQYAANQTFDEQDLGQPAELFLDGDAHGSVETNGAAGSEAEPHAVELEETVWCIGAGADCAIRVQAATDHIAHLVKRGPRVFVRNLGSREDMLVNGERLGRRAERELTRCDDLNVAGTAVVIEQRCFHDETLLGIDTSPIHYPHPTGNREQSLCDGIFLRAKPGTLTAILGPVGCGKTVLLGLLTGDRQPATGRIVIGERYDLHRDAGVLSGVIGCVPQGDVLIPELTVRQSLDCRLRLRFPDMAARVRENLILDACRQVGVDAKDVNDFLAATIGTAEAAPRGLSGGERKLANIAHELLLKPRILILDEPTSGLSFLDAQKVIRLLRELASREGLTVIATVHQPSQAAFACFDDLLVMAEGGQMVYYGAASAAREYLEQASETPCALEANPAEFILGLLAERRETGRLVEYYRAHSLAFPLAFAAEADSAPRNGSSSLRSSAPRHFLAKLVTLARRNACVLWADKANLGLTLGQVPVIGLLMLLAFGGIQRDGAAFEEIVRRAYWVSDHKNPIQQGGRPVPIWTLLDEADARQVAHMISVPAAHRRGAVYFVLVAASVWFGILGGCREVVAEKSVLRREQKIGLNLAPYLAAKILVLANLTALQTALLTVLVVPGLLGQPWTSVAATWGILWLVAVTAAALGLAVSCLSPTQRFALTAVPLLMIPQMILGGMLRPEADLGEHQVAPRVLSWLTIQRWGFEAALNFDTYGTGGVMIQECAPNTDSRYGALDWVQFRNGSLPECFFAPKSPLVSLALPAAALVAASGCLLMVAHSQLRRSLSKRGRTQP